MSLFRGEPAHVWVRRLEQCGWPPEIAVEMARFLTEKGAAPPAWQDLRGQMRVTPSKVSLPRNR
jgi:hypothetical protein